MTKKQNLGQFFTKSAVWLKPQIIEFIKQTGKRSAYDPFAGDGDLLKALINEGLIDSYVGTDIDPSLPWAIQDGLVSIEPTEHLVMTNPPYLAKNSAKRNKLDGYRYFEGNSYEDLYLIALEKILESHDEVIAIIPETFILSNLFTERIHSLTILEENPFDDTDCPVCVVCFAKLPPSSSLLYKNDLYIGTLQTIKAKVKSPKKNHTIVFNVPDGQIGIRAIDGTSKNSGITFCLPAELNYDLKKISVSSRSITAVRVDEHLDINEVIQRANEILADYRSEIADTMLASFKGNNKEGKRRRRLDFKTARAILEEAIDSL